MTAKAIDIAREYYRLIQPIAARAAENDAALAPGEIARKLKSKFPDMSKADLARAADVMLAQMEMVTDDLNTRLARIKSLARVHLAAGADVAHAASIAAAFDKAAGEFDAIRRDLKAPDKLFPKKLDNAKS